MTVEQVAALGPAFAAYLRPFEGCFLHDRTREHLHTYCRGLLSDLPRKTVEPIARAAGTAVRTLQDFLRDHVWHQTRLRDQLQQQVAQRLRTLPAADLGIVGLIDETSQVKKGDKTPGVQRQWCGAVGKKENCVVTVHLGVRCGRYKTLVDGDLFLPEAWSDDRERCRQAAIPDEVVYRAKWRIALEQLDRAASNGLHLNWLTFDEYYGGKPGFLAELDTHSELYWIGEVPRNFRCLTRRPPAPAWLHGQARRQPGPVQFVPESAGVAGLPTGAADVGRPGMGGAGGPGLPAAGGPVDGADVLAARGAQRGHGRSDVLRVERAAGHALGETAACGVWPLERGDGPPKLHLKREVVRELRRQLQSMYRRCLNWPGGAGNAWI